MFTSRHLTTLLALIGACLITLLVFSLAKLTESINWQLVIILIATFIVFLTCINFAIKKSLKAQQQMLIAS